MDVRAAAAGRLERRVDVARKTGKTTIVDVARAAGTSVSSASVALRGEPGVSEQTRARILEAAQRLGFQPDQRASRLRLQQPRLIGVTFAVNQLFHTEVVEGLYGAADRAGYDLLLSATTPARSETQAVDNLLRDRCETLILVSPELGADQLSELGGRASVITVSSDLWCEGVDSVRTDDRQGVADAVGHLIAIGHRQIAYIDGGTAVMSAIRSAAYVEAMQAHGLERQVQVFTGRPDEEAGAELADRIVGSDAPLPTAVVAHNDRIAFGLLLTLRSRGIAVPDDVSIVGYDNTRTAALATIRLTTVSQDIAELARTALERAIMRTENTVPTKEIITPAHLVVRGTTGPPRVG